MARRGGAVHVATTRRHYKDQVYETHLLRRSYRQDGKVKTETLGNLSHLPAETIELIRRSLKGETFVPASDAIDQTERNGLGENGFRILRSLPHGDAAAAAVMADRLGLWDVIGPAGRERDLVVGLVLARVCRPGSKLAATRWWADSTAGTDLGITEASTDEVYAALDWLGGRKQAIEAALAARHLSAGGRVLFDLSSSWMHGSACPLARFGHSRDGKRGKPQIEYGILADQAGCPVAVEVFAGNTGDPTAFVAAVQTVRKRFGLTDITFVGDRGMITQARIDALRELPGADWVTALRAPQIKALVESGAIQMSLFDTANLAEISHPDYPGERLMVCRNPVLAEQRARTREALLQATEDRLTKLAATVAAGRLKDHTKIAVRAGRILAKHKMAKHFDLTVEQNVISWSRRTEAIEAEAATDGIYVVRTSLPPNGTTGIGAGQVVGVYKSLAQVEADFRSWKATDLQLRPVYHWTEPRVRAHVLLCLLAGYLTWHLRRALAPITFTDTDRTQPWARVDPVAPATASPTAKAKATTKRTADGQPVYSYQSLLAHLTTLTRNTCHLTGTSHEDVFDKLTEPTPTQRRAFELLGLKQPPTQLV
ncbi:MAG TPA: IS1634 family transposase [Streptosporangiaceae bacterium]|nr:IS1634 family transposase [Streptosporangiaceae bacterium]